MATEIVDNQTNYMPAPELPQVPTGGEFDLGLQARPEFAGGLRTLVDFNEAMQRIEPFQGEPIVVLHESTRGTWDRLRNR